MYEVKVYLYSLAAFILNIHGGLVKRGAMTWHRINASYCGCSETFAGAIDEKGRYMIEKGIARLDDLVADEVKRNNIKEVIRHCYAQNQYGSDIIINDEETRKIIKCSMPAFALIDKLQ
ncbi:hypothetical protein PUN28_003643 [Cardiocondyla obscurior]|uniref:Ant venom allergen Sol i 2/4 domain-containing protein n=1 Tax=Cardiocondyla obscurior TaxID=286306 RepID=A0AAW2GNA3_9HYME